MIARIAAEGEAAPPPQAAPAPKPEATRPSEPAEQPQAAAPQPKPSAPEPAAAPQPAPQASPAPQAEENVTSLEERRRTRSSPLVRKIARENDIDISQNEGSGVSGRVTKDDILEYMERPRAAASVQPAPQPRPSSPPAAPQREPGQPSASPGGENIRIEPMSVMRKKIADHMVFSKRTSAHVSTVFEVDFTAIDRLRKQHKASYAERGVSLTYMAFIVQAVITALREFPIINSSIDGDNIIYKDDLNIGIAVALDWGLIVPVLKRADEKNILGIARSISELAERARTKKLNPEDVQGGTFTITNPGVYGGLFGLPIINQPQVAILGVGGVKKRPVVVETEAGDAIVVRSMCYLSLTFDHRIIDGAVADQFMARVRSIIEAGQYSL